MRQAVLWVAYHQKGLKGKETKSTLPISELEVSLWRCGSFEFVKKEHMERRTAASLHIAIFYSSDPHSSCLTLSWTVAHFRTRLEMI